MKYTVVNEPIWFLEALSVADRVVNGISYSEIKSRLLKSLNGRTDATYAKAAYEKFDSIEELARRAVDGVDFNNPDYAYYFKRFSTNNERLNCNLAKVLLFSFYDLGYKEDGKDEDFIESTRSGYCKTMETDYCILDTSIYGLQISQNDTEIEKKSLFDQVYSLKHLNEYRLELFRVLNDFETHLGIVCSLIRPIVDRLKENYYIVKPLHDQCVDYWNKYFIDNTLRDFSRTVFNTDLDVSSTCGETVVHLFTFGLNEAYIEQSDNQNVNYALHIGIGIDISLFDVDPQYTDEHMREIFKLLSFKTTFDIFRALNGKSSYCQEIADCLNLNTGTVSRQLNVLASYGLLNIDKRKARLYYTINTEAIENLINNLRPLLTN